MFDALNFIESLNDLPMISVYDINLLYTNLGFKSNGSSHIIVYDSGITNNLGKDQFIFDESKSIYKLNYSIILHRCELYPDLFKILVIMTESDDISVIKLSDIKLDQTDLFKIGTAINECKNGYVRPRKKSTKVEKEEKKKSYDIITINM